MTVVLWAVLFIACGVGLETLLWGRRDRGRHVTFYSYAEFIAEDDQR